MVSMKKLFIFIIVFTILNLSFIPLMALYGLSVCPILKVPGFLFGCAYTGTYILTVLVSNLFVIYFVFFSGARRLPIFIQKNVYLVYIMTYIFSSAIGLLFLQWLFDLNHLSGDSRAPEILGLTSLLLGITQAYGLNWALGSRTPSIVAKIDFDKSWLRHTSRTMAPIFSAVLILSHFMLIQSFLLDGQGSFQVTTEEVIQRANYIILFVVFWLSITYFFHFMSEKDAALVINKHLQNLEDGKYDYRSEERGSWGLWQALIQYLNNFSKAFGERTKLLNSFSRFVTGEVAQHALEQEITSVSGKEEELTVIMSDIRDFTKLSTELPADKVVKMLNGYFTVMLDEMVKYSIAVDKFIGDGILAYVDDEKLTSRASNQQSVQAALGMLERLKGFNKDSMMPEIRIGIGICRGPLIKGYIGSREKLQHTIIGDTVNKVARLESLCKELHVSLIITKQVWEDLDENFRANFKIFKNVSVKGISEEFDVYGLIV